MDWTRISWNEVCPAGTDVSFQVAVSEDADGPWSYGSSLTTAAGTTITSTTGRYARFKLAMTGDGSDTPVVNDVQITHDGTSGSRVTRWTYDDAGNITEQARVTDAGTETDVRTYNSLNQLTTSNGGWTYQYDLDGNLTGKNNGTAEDCEKWEYGWNENSRLVQVKKGVYDATPALVNEFTVDYQYDEMGRMLRRDDGTDVTDYFYDGWDIWKEVTGESVTEYLVPGLGIRSFLRDGELYTLHADGVGSVRTITDNEGAVIATLELDAWGEILPGSVDLVPNGLSMTFIGAFGVRVDQTTGLVWMRNRWFIPQLERFASRDPYGVDAGPNLYVYCSNQPHVRTDPSGLDDKKIGIEVFLIGGIRVPFKDGDFANAYAYIKARRNQVEGLHFNGHSGPEMAGADTRDHHSSGLWMEPDHRIYSFTEVDPDWDTHKVPKTWTPNILFDIKFPKLKYIKLFGCNTAGGHPKWKEMAKKYPKQTHVNRFGQTVTSFDKAPSDDNMAHQLAKQYPGVKVWGNKGPFYGGKFNSGTVYQFVDGKGTKLNLKEDQSVLENFYGKGK